MARPPPPLPRLRFAFVAPFRDFLRTQSASGLLLVLATAAALAWANSRYAGSYEALVHARASVVVGQPLGELDARGRYGVNVLGAWPSNNGGATDANRKLKPVGGDYRTGLGDTLLLVGEREAVAAFLGLNEAGAG